MTETFSSPGLTPVQRSAKRAFDLAAAAVGLALSLWIILPAYIIASIDTGRSGFFTQPRVGRGGKIFRVIKIRTMKSIAGISTTVTGAHDPRITRIGHFFRRTKIDELPQLFNVLAGDMSFVGPRPDVPGFADRLEGEDRVILNLRPGITGPATLKFRNEEELVARQTDPERYNSEVIFPEKTRLNRAYVEEYSLRKDLYYIWRTLVG